jgi:hypothetical protein
LACDVIDREVAVVAKRNNHAVIRREGRNRIGGDIAVMGLSEWVTGRDRDLDRYVRRPPAAGAQPITTGVHEDPVEPML